MTHIKRCPSFAEPPARERLISTVRHPVSATVRSTLPLSVCICQSIGLSVCQGLLKTKKKSSFMQHRLRGGFCSSCPASWKQMREAKAVFHGCFKAFPGSSQFVCQDEIKAGTSWHIVVLHAGVHRAKGLIFFFSFLSHVTQI